MRYTSQFKEQFSLAYAHAVASVAGCAVTRVAVDVNGYDVTFSATDEDALPRHPKVDAQLKCTAQNILQSEHLSFSLDVPTYNKLRRDTLVPRLLIVVTVPPDPGDWLVHSEEEMVLRRCGYWVSLLNAEETQNEKEITVHVPRAQRFCPETLQAIMERVDRDQAP